jgi:hypothetical protein
MKRIAIYLFICCFGMMSSNVFGQATTACNNKTAPEVTPGMSSTLVGGTVWTTPPPMSVAAVGLANTEYLIIKVGTCALDSARVGCDTTAGGGDVIVGASANGNFDPGAITRYGITISAGDTFAVVAVGFNLSQIKGLVNQIYTGTTPPPINAPCCSIFNLVPESVGFCDTLRANGINTQNDVTGLKEILTIFDAFASPQLSVESLVSYMELINSPTYSSLLSNNNCGTLTDGKLLCYGLNPNARYMYKASPTVAVELVDGFKGFAMFPNPTASDVTIRFDVETASDMTLNIYNAMGSKVSSQNLGTVVGEQILTASTSELATGMYMVELTNGRNSQTVKLIVQ